MYKPSQRSQSSIQKLKTTEKKNILCMASQHVHGTIQFNIQICCIHQITATPSLMSSVISSPWIISHHYYYTNHLTVSIFYLVFKYRRRRYQNWWLVMRCFLLLICSKHCLYNYARISSWRCATYDCYSVEISQLIMSRNIPSTHSTSSSQMMFVQHRIHVVKEQ